MTNATETDNRVTVSVVLEEDGSVHRHDTSFGDIQDGNASSMCGLAVGMSVEAIGLCHFTVLASALSYLWESGALTPPVQHVQPELLENLRVAVNRYLAGRRRMPITPPPASPSAS